MRLAGIRTGDIVEVCVRGHRGLCHVESPMNGALEVEPITPGFGYRRVSTRQVTAHWRRAGGGRG